MIQPSRYWVVPGLNVHFRLSIVVCVSVGWSIRSLLAYLRNYTSTLSNFSRELYMAVARSFPADMVLQYIRPVCLSDFLDDVIFAHNRLCESNTSIGRLLKVTHQGQHRAGTESDLYDCLLFCFQR